VTVTLSLVHERRAAVRAAGATAPLLLLLHGVGSNERSMVSLAPAFDPRFEVLSVRSPLTLGPTSFAWFHVQFTSQGPVIAADEAREGWELIARFVDEAVAAYDIDPTQVYVGGFSQGGIMSLAAVLTSPVRIAGAACMSGRLLPEVLPFAADAASLRDKPVLIVHGVEDTKLGIAFARDAREKLSTLGVALTYHEVPMGHEVTAESLGLVSAWLTARLDA
jgi:phospholipase/carboxylesterase